MIVSFPSELPTDKPWAFSFGIFDGVHVGHQAIFHRLVQAAEDHHAIPAAVFFTPHPKALFDAGHAPLAIGTREQKISWLNGCGVQYVVQMPFTPELAALTPEDFLTQHFLGPGLDIAAFCVGENWRFGYHNTGDGQTLRELSVPRNIETIIVPSVQYQGAPVSSTRIRQAIQEGDMEQARIMLGRPFAIAGAVSHGNHVGASILNCPTANLPTHDRVLPPFGVYAARGRLDDGTALDGIAYLGDAPTIRQEGLKNILLELHLFDFSQQLYGRPLSAELYQFIRPSIRFESPEALQQQIQKDIQLTKSILDKTLQ